MAIVLADRNLFGKPIKTTTMPVYMDRHDVSEKVTATHLTELHQLDLDIQHKFHCRTLTHWFDEKRKAAFCLVEAPCKQAIVDMHMEAHGDLPGQIIEVDPAEVKSYLGRLSEKEPSDDAVMNQSLQSAFRVLMMIGVDEGITEQDAVPELVRMDLLKELFPRYYGRIAKVTKNSFLIAFPNATQTMLCALEIYSRLAEEHDDLNLPEIELKTGISAGLPVTGATGLFEEARKEANALFYISEGNIAISPEVKSLYEDENPGVYLEQDFFVTLSQSDQKFLVPLMDYLDETWQNPYLRVEDLERGLGYSKSQLYRKIVSLLGETPNNFIKNYRLRKALKRIRRHSESITEIAGNTGFKSPSYFAKCFQKRYGILPSVYMQQGIA